MQRQMAVRGRESVVSTVTESSVFDQIARAAVEQTHVVDVDRATSAVAQRHRDGPAQRPDARADVARGYRLPVRLPDSVGTLQRDLRVRQRNEYSSPVSHR